MVHEKGNRYKLRNAHCEKELKMIKKQKKEF
jgi:hypothetical protein